jgi:hypothetical protein
MEDPMTRCATRSIVPLLMVVLAAGAAAAAEPVNTTPFGNLAVKGYDPVAYVTDGEPAKGSKEHELELNGARHAFPLL